MNLKKIVIHEVVKEATVKEADVNFSDRCLKSSEPKRIALVSKLAESFRKPRNKVDYSDFQSGERFPEMLDAYLEGMKGIAEPTDNDFLDFSKKATNHLMEIIENIAPAKGGYLVFTEYILQQMHYISIFLVRNTQGDFFTEHKGVLDVENIRYTDTEKLAMACRINIGKYLSDEKTPLMMINKKTSEVSEYFATWLGANDRESSEHYTDLLHDIIIDIEPPNDSKNEGEKISSEEVRSRVYDVIKSDHEGNANINLISELVFGNEDTIANYLDENHIDLPTEFKVYPTAMKRLVEVNVKDGDIRLHLSRGDLNRKVELGQDNRVIITSEAIFNELSKEKGENGNNGQ